MYQAKSKTVNIIKYALWSSRWDLQNLIHVTCNSAGTIGTIFWILANQVCKTHEINAASKIYEYFCDVYIIYVLGVS